MALKFRRQNTLKVKHFVYRNKVRRILNRKPLIPYLEVHLADHCNLNCQGCGHFSPFADKHFADINTFSEDLKRVSQLVSNVGIIRLLGGEPLLHKEIASFIRQTRRHFPHSNIRIVSNGILLQSMPETFWKTCQENNVAIDLTIYPPFVNKKDAWIDLIEKYGLEVTASNVTNFFDFVNADGNSEQEHNFKMCRKWLYCPMLREGKIFVCALPALASYYNSKHNTQIPTKDYLNIFRSDIDGWDIFSKINSSAEACRHCTAGWKNPPSFQWTQTLPDTNSKIHIETDLTCYNEEPIVA